MQEYSIILSGKPDVHEKPIFILIILGAHIQQDDWLARFLFLHLSSIFSTFINVELSNIYETYHKLECSLKVTVTKWIPLLLNFNGNIAQYIYFCLVKSKDFFFSYTFFTLRKITEKGRLKGFWEQERRMSCTENFAPCYQLWKARLLSLWSWLLSFVLRVILVLPITVYLRFFHVSGTSTVLRFVQVIFG